MCAEWAARPTATFRACTPARARSVSSSSAASASPETIAERGPFTAATTSRPDQRSSLGASSSAAAMTETISPRPASVAWAWLHRATTLAASSRDSASATAAEVISPTLWPSTAPGSTPYERQSSVSDSVIANSTGCTTSARPRLGESASGAPRSRSMRDQSVKTSSAAAQSSIRRRKTGEVSSSRAAMPGHWAPWPG